MTTGHPSLTPAPQANSSATSGPVPLAPQPLPEALRVSAWDDPVVDNLGHDPRSLYVERYWLGVLGPSTVWFIRRVADHLDREPAGFTMPLHQWARELGIGMRQGKRSPFMRSIDRACQFGLARQLSDTELAVRRHMPPLTQGQLKRLPEPLQQAHDQWRKAQLGTSALPQHENQARAIALALLESGSSVGQTERQMLAWEFDEVLAYRALGWARRHQNPFAS